MILINDLGVNIGVSYSGENLNEYKEFIAYMKSLNAIKNYKGSQWIIPKAYLQDILDKFKTEKITNPWDSLGSSMKLSPFPYQKEAIYYALNNPNSLLILPPGAGKTPIAVGIVLEYNPDDPVIVCTKTSLKYQWIKEIEKFSDLRANIINSPSKTGKKFDMQFEDCDVYVLNYETLKNEKVCEKLREYNVCGIIMDEMQVCNNFSSERTKALYKFNDLPLKIGTTATPITNNPLNLFGIFNMINKNVFESYNKFSKRYVIWKYRRPVKAKNVPEMIDKVRPYIFIKNEKDIAGQLPELNVFPDVICEMTDNMEEINGFLQRKLKELNDTLEALDKKGVSEMDERWIRAQANLQAYQTYAQELADDISLLDPSNSLLKDIKIYDKTNPKLEALLEIVGQIIESENKVCIFTRYERMQGIIHEAIKTNFKQECAVVNGSMSPEDRYDNIYNKFTNGDVNIIIATDAMAEGASLSTCKYLIEYEPASSYAVQTQRRGRIRRANSISKVSHVYQLVTEKSWDEIQLKSIKKKKGYDDSLKDL